MATVHQVRRRIAAMRDRWGRDLKALETMFPNVDFEWGDDTTEIVRNLATAIQYANGVLAMSEVGVRRSIDRHAKLSRRDLAALDRGQRGAD